MSERICPECELPDSAKPGEPHCIVSGGDNCRLRTIARLKAVNAELEAALVAADRMRAHAGYTAWPGDVLKDYDTARERTRK